MAARMCQKPEEGAQYIEYLLGFLRTCMSSVYTWQVTVCFDEEWPSVVET
jgi:hypothetical protein